jgi:hypothetical protein
MRTAVYVPSLTSDLAKTDPNLLHEDDSFLTEYLSIH